MERQYRSLHTPVRGGAVWTSPACVFPETDIVFISPAVRNIHKVDECLPSPPFAMKMEVTRFSESVTIYHAGWRHVTENGNVMFPVLCNIIGDLVPQLMYVYIAFYKINGDTE